MKKSNLLVIIFLLIQPFLDIIAGSNLPGIHIFIRGLFFLFCFIYLIKNKKDNKNILLLTILMFIYFISYLLLYRYNLINSISYTLKLFYLPITVIFFYNYKDEIDNKYILLVFLGYITLFLLCYFLDLGNEVYVSGVKKEGFKGLFNSINEFSAIIIILLPLVLKYLQDKGKYISCIILAIIVAIISMLTGTKVILGGVIIIFLYFLYKPFVTFFKKITLIKKILVFTFMILFMSLGCFLITNTTAYKNAIVQANFFKVDNVLSIEGINKVIFNDRFSFVKNNQDRYNNSKIFEKFLGLKNNNNFKTVEIDLFDIFYQYGLIGLLIIISVIIYYCYKSRLKDVYLLTVILFLLISETSGHVLIYPAVSLYLGVTFYLNKKDIIN